MAIIFQFGLFWSTYEARKFLKEIWGILSYSLIIDDFNINLDNHELSMNKMSLIKIDLCF